MGLSIQERLLKFVTTSNWILLIITSAAGFAVMSTPFALGIVCGGLIVTVNFHLLHRTLKKAFVPSQLVSHNVILAKYYLRFMVSGLIIFFLISQHLVNPLGLFIGLSVVVASITLATLIEFKNLISKEAV